MNLATIITFTYGILSIVGGIIGYKQAGSKISLISGAISGLLLIIAGILQLQGQSYGFVFAGVITGILVIVFALRLQKTRKFMPAGLMTVLGVVTLLVIASQLFKAST
ncbi:hypothetical protein RIVM261_055840 [Rivularia sp. IAM M-261]|nr:hypothetical protein CAL7716_009600 [Calothrix sp. PCC 7716]GJD20628.1 hypothetical protein RIVM261_055840 [Rivularia sp. IAM M-261]